MTKDEAIQTFWSGYELNAYDELSLPDNVTLPYITYSVVTDAFENVVSLLGSLWYHSNSWEAICDKKDEISEDIGMGGKLLPIDGGYLWITRGSPFAQRMQDPSDDKVKRMYINCQAEFLSAD
ncbi:MAG: hypothetical protein K5637_01970 [Lachnospiraceae bacterium]|nr:hypothetical protein [Lachnospiraceae bacterium]